MSGFVFDCARLKNTFATRVSSCPERSAFSIVFSNVAFAGSFAIASISARWTRMPSSKAGA